MVTLTILCNPSLIYYLLYMLCSKFICAVNYCHPQTQLVLMLVPFINKTGAQRGDAAAQGHVADGGGAWSVPRQVQATGAGCPHAPVAPSCPQVGDITILVNNAAVVHGKSLMDSDDDALLKSQHINTLGQFWVRALLALS